MLQRRDFLKRVTVGAGAYWLAACIGANAFLTGCTVTLADVLAEIGNVLTLIAPLIEGILPIVAISDPAVSSAVAAANTVFQSGVTAVSGFLKDWANASASAQPGILAQLKAA